jgi:hypothetical protein
LVHHQWMCPFAGKKERLPQVVIPATRIVLLL